VVAHALVHHEAQAGRRIDHAAIELASGHDHGLAIRQLGEHFLAVIGFERHQVDVRGCMPADGGVKLGRAASEVQHARSGGCRVGLSHVSSSGSAPTPANRRNEASGY
jgi:hypothetical protein